MRRKAKIKVDPKIAARLQAHFRMGKIRDDGSSDIVYETPLIGRTPIPQVAFPGWSVDHTKKALSQPKRCRWFPQVTGRVDWIVFLRPGARYARSGYFFERCAMTKQPVTLASFMNYLASPGRVIGVLLLLSPLLVCYHDLALLLRSQGSIFFTIWRNSSACK